MKKQSVRTTQRRFSSIIDSIIDNDLENFDIKQPPKTTFTFLPRLFIFSSDTSEEILNICIKMHIDDLIDLLKSLDLKLQDIKTLVASFVDSENTASLYFNIRYTSKPPLSISESADEVLVDFFNTVLTAAAPSIVNDLDGHTVDELFEAYKVGTGKDPDYFYISSSMEEIFHRRSLHKDSSKPEEVVETKETLPDWWEVYKSCYPEAHPSDRIRIERQEWAMFAYQLQRVIKSLIDINVDPDATLVGTVFRNIKKGEFKTIVETVVERIVNGEIGIQEYTSLYNIFSLKSDTIENFNYNVGCFTSAFKSKRGLGNYIQEDNIRNSRSRDAALKDFRDEQYASSRGCRGSRD